MANKRQKGFVLLSAIAVLVVLGMMSAVMVNLGTSTSELGASALQYHRAQSALQSHINLVGVELAQAKACTKPTFHFTWQQVELSIDCTSNQQGDILQLVGRAKVMNAYPLPVEASQTFKVKLNI